MTTEEYTAFFQGQLNASNKIKDLIKYYRMAAKRLQDKAKHEDTIDRNQYLQDILTAIETEIDAFNFTDPKN